MSETTAWRGAFEVSLGALFMGFFRIGLTGFGGVAPVAHHEIVERRRWLSDADYANVLGVGKILPGANTMNAAVIIGDRFRGPLGAAVAVFAILAAPIAIAVGAMAAYLRIADNPIAQAAMQGAAAAAAGLVIGTGLKMARGVRPNMIAVAAGVITLVAIAVFHAPLLGVVLVLGPLVMVAFYLARRRVAGAAS